LRPQPGTLNRIGALVFAPAFAFALAALAMLAAQPAPARAGSTLPPDKHIAITATTWLSGHGVSVYYPPHAWTDHPQNADGTIQYECVELMVRLYAQAGYTGTWSFYWAYQVASIPGRPGFEDMTFRRNGKATELPRPGDIIVWSPNYYSWAGHVAIVNRVEITQVEAIHQNLWRGDLAIPVTMVLMEQDAQGNITLRSKDGSRPSGWIHSARMEAWLNMREPALAAR
jgi:hypothetical protein